MMQSVQQQWADPQVVQQHNFYRYGTAFPLPWAPQGDAAVDSPVHRDLPSMCV